MNKKLISLLTMAVFISSLSGSISVKAATSGTDESSKKWNEQKTSYGYYVTNKGGKALGYSADSGVKLLFDKGFAFKDLNKNRKLDNYEDWRLNDEERAKDLASKLSVDQIAGLMLYSPHQWEVGEKLSDELKGYVKDSGVRAVLNAADQASVKDTVKWSNALQAYAEAIDFGIPVNVSSDPRSTAKADGVYVKGTEGGISRWPSNLGIAATFSEDTARRFGKVSSTEFRMLGINTALAPQVDLATDPRWTRFNGTFGEDPALSRDLTKALIEGMQSAYDGQGKDLGWGENSVNAMIKHWPGDGVGESGRESHTQTGKYAVYPGNQFETQLIPFVDGGLKLDSKTGCSSSVMSSYSIAWSNDGSLGEKVGSAYSKYKITQLLRDKYGYDGVICTDWFVTSNMNEPFGTPWGMEDKSIEERHYKALMAGVDQFGGDSEKEPVIAAYNMGVKEHGEKFMRNRFETSAVRLLKNIFHIGLFENPYVDMDAAVKTVGNAEYMNEGFNAQVKSVVMLKNQNNVISPKNALASKPTVYIPMVFTPVVEPSFPGVEYSPAKWSLPVNKDCALKYFNVVTDTISPKLSGKDKDGNPMLTEKDIIRLSKEEIRKCDYVLPVINSPRNAGTQFIGYGYNKQDGYIPISLQYGKYTADSSSVRKQSIAGNAGENRSYFGKTAKIENSVDLESLLYGANAVKGTNIPVIAIVRADNPMVFSEVEPNVDGILMGFGVSDQAYYEIITGKAEPSGLLPMQMPLNMDEVEKQCEDVPRDMSCYKDSQGNRYDFAFGLNWSGVIKDNRTKKYDVQALKKPTNMGK